MVCLVLRGRATDYEYPVRLALRVASLPKAIVFRNVQNTEAWNVFGERSEQGVSAVPGILGNR